jgi:hypothetical protein
MEQCQRAFSVTMDGRDAMDAGKDDAAVAYFDRAVATCPSDALAWRYRGEAYARLNETELAILDLRRAIAIGLDERAHKRAVDLLAKLETPPGPPPDRVEVAEASPQEPAETEPADSPTDESTAEPPPAPAAAEPAAQPPAADAVEPDLPEFDVIPAAGEPASSYHGPVSDAVRQSVQEIFDKDADTRIAASTGLLVDKYSMQQAVPLAVESAYGQIENTAGLTNTLRLLRNAAPATLQADSVNIHLLLERASTQGPEISALADQVRAAKSPVVSIHIGSEEQRKVAERLEEVFLEHDFFMAGIENVAGRAALPEQAEVRTLGSGSRGATELLVAALRQAGFENPRTVTLKGSAHANDTYEVWLDARTCVAPERISAICR